MRRHPEQSFPFMPGPFMPAAFMLVLPWALALGGCGEGKPVPAPLAQPSDPAIVAALSAPLMIDPDLAELNQPSAAGAFASLSRALPPDDHSKEAIAAARQEAQAMLGGASRVAKTPAPAKGEGAADAAIASAEKIARGRGCDGLVSRTARWAAAMPPLFPIYPRGAVIEASGTDEAGCALRRVRYGTPVPASDVLDFYYSSARTGGFSVRHVLSKGGSTLGGTAGGKAFVLRLWSGPGGRTDVELVTGGS